MIFYDPHPGLAGCPIPIPEKVRKEAARIAERSNRKSYSLRYVQDCIRLAAGRGFIVQARDHCIFLFDGPIDSPEGYQTTNCWRVLRYKEK